MKISIIIPVYNSERYLRRCVESLLKQSFKNIEIILVDDGSGDGSGRLCDELHNEDSRVVVIHQKNAGVSAARNAGLMRASGDYIGFSDSDDFADEDMYQALSDAAQRHNADIVMCGARIIGGKMFDTKGYEKTCYTFDEETVFNTPEQMESLVLGTVGAPIGVFEDSQYGVGVWKNLFRTSLLRDNNISFLSQRKYGSEDMLFTVECMLNAESAVGITGAYYNYNHNNESLSNSRVEGGYERSLLLNEVLCERLGQKIPRERYLMSTDRLMLAYARAISTQEVLFAVGRKEEKRLLKKRLREICKNPKTKEAFSRFPYKKLPLMQAIYAFALKYCLTGLLIILVRLRSKI